eukprot:10243709-Lingulodinium_polyedra.AAC.1
MREQLCLQFSAHDANVLTQRGYIAGRRVCDASWSSGAAVPLLKEKHEWKACSRDVACFNNSQFHKQNLLQLCSVGNPTALE